MNTVEDYKYTTEGKIKREFISNSIIIDGLYERSSLLHTKPYNDDRYWEEENHLYDDIRFYKTQFNAIILKEALINKVEDCGIEHTNKPNCFCVDCIIKDKINNLVFDGGIQSLDGVLYHQIYKSNKPYIIKRNSVYYNMVNPSNAMTNKEVPLTDFIDTLY